MISGTALADSNDLLAALSQRERDRVLKQCERVTLAQDEILAEPGERIRDVWFPIDSFISLLTDHHGPLAVGLIGSEGMLGTSLVLGVSTSPLHARVHGAGSALRMKAADFQRVLTGAPNLERQLRHYLQVLLVQIAQTATCAAFHVVEVRLAYWLLMAQDRAHSERFYLTHGLLSQMLGVRRSGVTTAAGVLQGRKLISYTRGHIAILNRKGLEQATCGCYRAVREMSRQISHADAHRGDPEGDHVNGRPLRHPGAPRAGQEDSTRPLGPGVAAH